MWYRYGERIRKGVRTVLIEFLRAIINILYKSDRMIILYTILIVCVGFFFRSFVA